jgi:hypothetical protein
MENDMKRLILIAATGFLALALTACGENSNQRPTVDNTQQQVPAPQQQPNQGQGR